MKKLFKLLSLIKLVKDLRGRRSHGYGAHRSRHYPQSYGGRGRSSRLRDALRGLLGRRGY